MWAELKMNHANNRRTRGEIAIIAVSLALIGVMLITFVTLARAQVHKAEMREALRQSQRVAMARCWQDSVSPLAMRACMADVRTQTARALEESYGLPAREAPVAVQADMAVVSYRY